MHRTLQAAVVVFGVAGAVGPAAADCYELIGCPNDHNIPVSELRQLSCDSLWTVRNAMYDEGGYCFKTAKALAVYSNDGCLYNDAAQVPLNSYERTNISRIGEVEKSKGC